MSEVKCVQDVQHRDGLIITKDLLMFRSALDWLQEVL